MRTDLCRTAAVLMPLLLVVPAAAQTTSPAATPTGPATMAPPAASTAYQGAMAPGSVAANLSAADRMFVEKAAEGGIAEVQMAQLAQQKTQSSAIRQFAQTMIDDHTPANQKLAELATSKGITAPTQPSAMQQKMMTKLQGLDGARFDHAYITGQLKAHETMLKLFQREVKDGTDPNLKMFAEQQMPVLQKHLSMAEADKSSS